jgi:hypothetical protein
VKLSAFDWLLNLLRRGCAYVNAQLPLLVGSVLRAVADTSAQVSTHAIAVSQLLLGHVRHAEPGIPLDEIIKQVITASRQEQSVTRRMSLAWFSMLLEREPVTLLKWSPEIVDQLLENITGDCDDDELSLHVQVLALFAKYEGFEPATSRKDGPVLGDRILQALVELFRDEGTGLLERRGSYLVRHFCVVMDPTRVISVVSDGLLSDSHPTTPTLPSEETSEFAYIVVEMLSLVLLTAPEMSILRASLQRSSPSSIHTEAGVSAPEPNEIFSRLFRSWACNPISALLLCLLSEQYVLANAIVRQL